MDALRPFAASLGELLMTDGGGGAAEDTLSALYTEQNALRLSASADANTASITAERPGIFSSAVDGYESITPETLSDITPGKLLALQEKRTEPMDQAIGKLIVSSKWYYCARIAAEFGGRLKPGDTVKADFGRFFSEDVTLRVDYVSDAEYGERAVIFSCADSLSDTLSSRLVSADIKFGERSGLRVPDKAVQTDEDGVSFVYVYTALYAEKKIINIVYEGDGFVLCGIDGDSDALHEGDTIIVDAPNLYDGKVMGK
jgi:hypothetical protein